MCKERISVLVENLKVVVGPFSALESIAISGGQIDRLHRNQGTCTLSCAPSASLFQNVCSPKHRHETQEPPWVVFLGVDDQIAFPPLNGTLVAHDFSSLVGGKGNKKPGGTMKKIGTTSSGNIIVEMTPEEWAKRNKDLALSLKEDLPSLLTQFRHDNKISQKAFARRAGISRNTIIGVEGGKAVTYATAQKILAAITGDKAP